MRLPAMRVAALTLLLLAVATSSLAWFPAKSDATEAIAASVRASIAEAEKIAPPGQVQGPIYFGSEPTNEALREASLQPISSQALKKALPEDLAERLQPNAGLDEARTERSINPSENHGVRSRRVIANKGIFIFVSEISRASDGYDVSLGVKYNNPKESFIPETRLMKLSVKQVSDQWRVTSRKIIRLVQ